MEKVSVTELMLERFESMPPRLQAAASFVLEHPTDVALMSMRGIARKAGVPHTTMVRLAESLGLEGYEDLRASHAQMLRERLSARNGSSNSTGRHLEEGYFTATRIAESLAAQVANLGSHHCAEQLSAAADILVGSRHLFCLGSHAAHAVACHFIHVLSHVRDGVTLLDATGRLDMTALRRAGAGDAMLAISTHPTASATVEIARQASCSGVAVVAIIDSGTSPLVRLARQNVVVTSNSQSFFKSMAPLLAASEALAALIADRNGVCDGEVPKNGR
jgi:DNA-binding MurR/RpiR family transcriptional regulator